MQASRRFLNDYQPVLEQVSGHLQQMMENTDPAYAKAYSPWLSGLRDLCRGVYILSRGLPLPDPAALMDALHMFRFDSTLLLLQDLCISARIALKADWISAFRRDIDSLLFAAAAQYRQQGHAR